LDILRANAIPALIDADYSYLGLDSIGFNFKEVFFCFDTKKDSVTVIYEKLIEAISDKQEILKRKKKINEFYLQFIQNDRSFQLSNFTKYSPWLDCYAAKLIDFSSGKIQEKRQFFFSKSVVELKNNKF